MKGRKRNLAQGQGLVEKAPKPILGSSIATFLSQLQIQLQLQLSQ